LTVFNGLGAWFCRKLVVLRNLEAKLLKKRNLRGPVDGVEQAAEKLSLSEKALRFERARLHLCRMTTRGTLGSNL
jgi:hypothetical protein